MNTKRHLFRLIVTLAIGATGAIQARPVEAAGPTNFVTLWNQIAVDTAVGVMKRPGAAATIDLTLVHAAVYDAVNAIDGVRFKPYASAPPAPSYASVNAAVATAAHDILVWLFPDSKDQLDAQLTLHLGSIADGPEEDAGIAAGAAAANAVIVLRTGDGRNDPSVVYWPTSGAGLWELTPPAYAAPQTPWVAKVRPFTMTSPSQFRPVAPPALTSAEYTKAFNETKSRGAMNGSVRTDAQTSQALFWAEHFATQYNRYLRDLVGTFQLSVPDTARLFAQVNMAAADSLIACWDAKYTYAFWRPVTAIRQALVDGNPGTEADGGWSPLVTTPNHPEYPSAHGCGSGAIADTLTAFFGTDRVRTTITSTTDATPRIFENFHDLYNDVHESRILAGLHFRFSMNAGRVVGSKVSRQLVKKYFVPMD